MDFARKQLEKYGWTDGKKIYYKKQTVLNITLNYLIEKISSWTQFFVMFTR